MERKDTEYDFMAEDCNGFYYTNERHIRNMDDALVLSKLEEKYPDFNPSSDENMLKQTLVALVQDTRFVNEVTEKCDIGVKDLFALIYRNYPFLFGGCFVSKIQKLVEGRAYAKKLRASGRRRRPGKKSGK